MKFSRATLSDLPEFHVGHAQNSEAATGCTVVVSPDGATCSVDVRGGGPATRETDLLKPENMVEAVHAVVLSGGSAFGLDASTGVMQALAEKGIGFELCGLHVPIVVGACLFDLPYGKPEHPTAEMGAQACRKAIEDTLSDTRNQSAMQGTSIQESALNSKDASFTAADVETSKSDPETSKASFTILSGAAEGNVGAGCGATVGKMLDPAQATKSGLGIYGIRCDSIVAVAIVAVNALGTVCLPDGTPLAGHRDADGNLMNPLDPVLLSMMPGSSTETTSPSHPVDENSTYSESNPRSNSTASSGCTAPCTNTTIGVVLTNAKLTKAQCQKVSSITHDAYARTIKPVHTSADGDTIFTLASGKQDAPFDLVAIMATEAMQGAILRAVTTAKAACGLPAAQDINPELCTQIFSDFS